MSRNNGSDRFGKSNDNHRPGREDDEDDDELERAVDEMMRRGTGGGGKEGGNPQGGGAGGGAINPEMLLIAMMGQLMQALLQHKNNHEAPQAAAGKMATPGAELFAKYNPTAAVAGALATVTSRSDGAFSTPKVTSPTKSTARSGNSRTTRPQDGRASSSAAAEPREASGSSRSSSRSARENTPPSRYSSASRSSIASNSALRVNEGAGSKTVDPQSKSAHMLGSYRLLNDFQGKASIKQTKTPRNQAESSLSRYKSLDTIKTKSRDDDFNGVSKRVSSPPAKMWGSPVNLSVAKVNSPAPVVAKTTEEYCDNVSGAIRSSNSRMRQQMDRLHAEHMERQDRDTEKTVTEMRRLREAFTAKIDALMARAGAKPTTTSTPSAVPTAPSNRSSPASENPSPSSEECKSHR